METEQETIKFDFSKSGTPVIYIGNLGMLIFSKITSHPDKGYKYMCFSHEYVDIIKDKNGKRIEIPCKESHTVNMHLETKPKQFNQRAIGLPHSALPGRMKDFLKKSLSPMLNEKGYLSRNKINNLKQKLHGKLINEILDTVQKKRKPYKKRKKKTK